MKNIHVLPTDKPSRLYYNNNDQELQFCEVFRKSTPLKENQNIYITSDEEIEEGSIVKIPCGIGKVKELHWKYGNDNPSYIVEDIFTYELRYGQKEGELQINSFRYEDVKKIILTTDQDLIKDGVQAIDDEFLEWFVKNPSCEKVEIEKEWEGNGYMFGFNMGNASPDGSYVYKIIIPKEEPKQTDWKDSTKALIEAYGDKPEEFPYEEVETNLEKHLASVPEYKGERRSAFISRQETLEETAKKEIPNRIRSTAFGSKFEWEPTKERKAFIRGAKWQAERMYSEEDMRKSYIAGLSNFKKRLSYNLLESELSFEEWFEQFKKK